MLSFTRTKKLKLAQVVISLKSLLDIVHAAIVVRVVVLNDELAVILADVVPLVFPKE
jgi:hypothetical protein